MPFDLRQRAAEAALQRGQRPGGIEPAASADLAGEHADRLIAAQLPAVPRLSGALRSR